MWEYQTLLIGITTQGDRFYRMSQNIVPHSCGWCGGGVCSVVHFLIQWNRVGFHLEFETSFQPIKQLVSDLWHAKVKKVIASKNCTSVVFKQCQREADFERNGSGDVFAVFYVSKGTNNQSTFLKMKTNLKKMPEPFGSNPT